MSEGEERQASVDKIGKTLVDLAKSVICEAVGHPNAENADLDDEGASIATVFGILQLLKEDDLITQENLSLIQKYVEQRAQDHPQKRFLQDEFFCLFDSEAPQKKR